MENREDKRLAEVLGELTGTIINWFLTAGFIYWGWTIVAPHLNAPLFTYWEVFAIRMALSSLVAILWQRKI
jgi:hypothetical protein